MCHVCESEGLDWKYMNGADEDSSTVRSSLQRARLYRVYQDRVAQIKLCHIHSIELFLLGERRFLEHHPALCYELGAKQKKFAVAA